MNVLPILFKYGKLLFRRGVISAPVQIHEGKEIKNFFENSKIASLEKKLYSIYRGVCFEKDRALFKKNHLRYDITVILPEFVGEEFNRTIGHFHKKPVPEIYEVLKGKALFLFQNKKADKIYLIKAVVGQKIIVPLGFGHITINFGEKHLIVANIFNDNIKSDYSCFEKHHGPVYCVKKSKARFKNQKLLNKNAIIKKNQNYKKISALKICEPNEINALNISFKNKKSIYESFIKNPKNFKFLTEPEKFKNILKPEKLYRPL